MLTRLKLHLKRVLPKHIFFLILSLWNWRGLLSCTSFLLKNNMNISLQGKLRIVKQLYIISFNIESPHTHEEILSYIKTILSLPRNIRGVLVEAGCYKGGSTAKFSLAADIIGKELVIFDSFQGIPENDEPHEKTIFGEPAIFKKGDYCGTLEEVKANVAKFGRINCCRFVPGWFDDTMPRFEEPISAIYLDVDLASSTRICLKHLYPLLKPDGILYSQDGQLPLVIDVFDDDNFWLSEVGCEKPQILGLAKKRLIKIIKKA